MYLDIDENCAFDYLAALQTSWQLLQQKENICIIENKDFSAQNFSPVKIRQIPSENLRKFAVKKTAEEFSLIFEVSIIE